MVYKPPMHFQATIGSITDDMAKKNEEEIRKELDACDAPPKDGVASLFKAMKEGGFFTSPSSHAYHLCIYGGLAQHSLNVFKTLKSMAPKYFPDVPARSIVITGLLHDFCKMGSYKNKKTWKKVDESEFDLPNGKTVQVEPDFWFSYDGYEYDNSDPLGHGEKSVIRIQQHLPLLDDEIYAIRWHMGAWDTLGEYSKTQALNKAIEKSRLLRGLMIADQVATYFLED